MIRDLVSDEEVLSKPCEPATADDAELAQDLIDTMGAHEDAACLAANQVGVTKAVVVYRDQRGHAHAMYNPRILMGVHPSKTVEGCLTREEPSAVRRYDRIRVRFDELVDGELVTRTRDYTGWVAQMIQHMVDHCEGKLV